MNPSSLHELRRTSRNSASFVYPRPVSIVNLSNHS